MASPSEHYLGEIDLERWLTPGHAPGAAAPPPPSLSAMADRALTYLLGMPLPHRGYSCLHAHVLASCPPGRLAGSSGVPGELGCRIHRAISEARELTGRTDGEETDRRLWSALLDSSSASTSAGTLGVLLQDLAERFSLTQDPGDKRSAREVFVRLKGLAREKWDLVFFPGTPGTAEHPGAGTLSPLSSGSAAMFTLAYGKLCQDEEALELSRRLARGIAAGVQGGDDGLGEDGSFVGLSGPRVQDARAVGEVAATFADRDLLLWAQRVFEFVRRAGGDTGFVPRVIPKEAPDAPLAPGSSPAPPAGDTCAAAETACLAAALARAGFTSCYDALESFLRNHLPLVQFADTPSFVSWYARRHAARPREEVQAALARIAAECQGGFFSHVAPADLVAEPADVPPLLMAACCATEAVHAMAAAWRAGVTEAGGTVDVNLGLDRETPFVRVTASPPGEGRIAVAVKRQCGLRVRVPSWTDRSGMTVQRSGSPAMVTFDEGYVCLEDLHAGDTVVVRWPVPVFSQAFAIAGQGGRALYKWSWVGGTVIGVNPADADLPIWPARP